MKFECDVSSQMHVSMLSLHRPGLLVSGRVGFVEAIQDPRNLFKVKPPESEMAEVVIHFCSAILITCLALEKIGSCEAQHCFANKSKNRKKRGHSRASLDRGEQV